MEKTPVMLYKILVIGIIILFIGLVIAPTISSDTASSTTLDNDGSLLGYVNDISGNPIEEALVRVYFHGTYEENYSDSTGFYHVTNIPICYCMKNATCSKNGYKTEWVLLSIVENTTHDFVLTSNHPPNKPEITGPVLIHSPGPHEYTFKAIDPDGDDLFYEINWDDGTYEEWFGPYPSGKEITRNHTFILLLHKQVGIRAKDIHGAIGEWTNLTIVISRTQQMTNPLILRFFERLPFMEVFLRAMNLLR